MLYKLFRRVFVRIASVFQVARNRHSLAGLLAAIVILSGGAVVSLRSVAPSDRSTPATVSFVLQPDRPLTDADRTAAVEILQAPYFWSGTAPTEVAVAPGGQIVGTLPAGNESAPSAELRRGRGHTLQVVDSMTVTLPIGDLIPSAAEQPAIGVTGRVTEKPYPVVLQGSDFRMLSLSPLNPDGTASIHFVLTRVGQHKLAAYRQSHPDGYLSLLLDHRVVDGPVWATDLDQGIGFIGGSRPRKEMDALLDELHSAQLPADFQVVPRTS
jgi:preprotein translocase subunit SecD